MTRFKRNRHLDEQLERTARYRAALLEAAAKIAHTAEQVSPRRTGTYAGSFETHDDGREVTVGNVTFYAALVEFGTRDTPAHAPLRRGARLGGLKLREGDGADSAG